MEYRISPDNIQSLGEKEVFVFGSNLMGLHGAGAALTATELFGASPGVAHGIQGKSFAIPTKDSKLKPLELNIVNLYTDMFIDYAIDHPEKKFFLTEIGCGYAKFKPEQIAPMFKRAIKLPNVYFPRVFARTLVNLGIATVSDFEVVV